MGRPDKKQIEAWKKEHGSVYQIDVEDKIVILRKATLRDLERASAADPKNKKKFNFNRSILENCKLYQDEGALDTDGKLMAVFSELEQIIEVAEAETKKL